MLIKQYEQLEIKKTIRIQKRIGAEDVTLFGAFPYGTELTLQARVPRCLGISLPVLRIAPDGGRDADLPFTFLSREGAEDLYHLTLRTETLCPSPDGGLFFCEYLFLRGCETLFSDSINNVDFVLRPQSANRFRILIYRSDYQVPQWFSGGILYHIFLDRFCRGRGETNLRESGELNEDWENGIPQYAERPGDALKNNVFFGGNLWGISDKMDYLQSLGVTVLYLSPIFEAASNHRYDTGDYERIDALLGGEKAFDAVVKEAHRRGMRVLLDGVFNHTGSDSKYFNRFGTYPTVGAYQSESSPYAAWYRFQHHPEQYESWWGIEILPRLDHENANCRSYFTGKDGIAVKWLKAGADGWRLDVADELSDPFLEELRRSVKEESNGEALLIGEVWENAVDKIAYGHRRRYFQGNQLDSVMNYPFRNAVLAFLLYGDAETFYNTLTELYASYPPIVCHALMNLLGTHDTERILTVLGAGEHSDEELSNRERAHARLRPQERAKGIRLLKIGALLQYTVYGVPSVYYGDEVGLEGYGDPFCRMPYPWGKEDTELLEYYRRLGKFRAAHPVFQSGTFRFLFHNDSAFVFERRFREDTVWVGANMGEREINIPLIGEWLDAVSLQPIQALVLPPCGASAVFRTR